MLTTVTANRLLKRGAYSVFAIESPLLNNGRKVLFARLGAWGWKHDSWTGDVFYPDDLPEDWMLGYYSNEFNAVVVPAEYWNTVLLQQDEAVEELIENWCDDVHDAFCFHIDWPLTRCSDVDSMRVFAEKLPLFAHRLGKVLINASLWFQTDSAVQQALLRVLSAFDACCYGDCAVDNLKTAWQDTDSVYKCADIVLMHGDKAESIRDFSDRLVGYQKFKQQECEQPEITDVILAGDTIEINRLNEMKSLLQILGL